MKEICVATGEGWSLFLRFEHIFLVWKDKRYFLIELRRNEWNINPICIDGLRIFYEVENKKMLCKKLKQIGIANPETRVKIVNKIRKIAMEKFE